MKHVRKFTVIKNMELMQERFRELIDEITPFETRRREIGAEQIQLAFEINLEIAQRRFPLARVSDAGPTPPGEVLPADCVASPHDIPRKTVESPWQLRWALATLAPCDDGRSAETICQYLIDAKVEPNEILIQRAALRVLLVR